MYATELLTHINVRKKKSGSHGILARHKFGLIGELSILKQSLNQVKTLSLCKKRMLPNAFIIFFYNTGFMFYNVDKSVKLD